MKKHKWNGIWLYRLLMDEVNINAFDGGGIVLEADL
jgi:hypothetical protein